MTSTIQDPCFRRGSRSAAVLSLLVSAAVLLQACGGSHNGTVASAGNSVHVASSSGVSSSGASSTPAPAAAAACVQGPVPPAGGTPATVSVAVIYSFAGTIKGGTDGAVPNAGLLLGSDGNLYGTTLQGGSNVPSTANAGAGTVFRISTAGAETVLHSFGAQNDGANPEAALVMGCDGAFYGTTRFGGSTANTPNAGEGGTVYRIDTKGNESTLYTFGSTPTDGMAVTSPLVLSSDTNLYGTTVLGGSNGTGTIFKIDSTGAFQSIYSFGTTGGINPNGALFQASNGTLYATTLAGGSHGHGTIFSFQPMAAVQYADLYSFTELPQPASLPAEFFDPRGSFIQASTGTLYGVDSCAGDQPNAGTIVPCGNGVVFSLTTGGTVATVYSFPGTTQSQTMPQAAAVIGPAQPSGALVLAGDGNYYGVTTRGGPSPASSIVPCGTVFQLTPAGAVTVIYAFTCQPDGASPNGPLTIGPDGNLYGTTQSGGANNLGTVFKVTLVN